MASFAPKVDVTFTISVEQKVLPSQNDGQIRLKLKANVKRQKRFFKRLCRLCKKYGYTVGEIQKQKSEDK